MTYDYEPDEHEDLIVSLGEDYGRHTARKRRIRSEVTKRFKPQIDAEIESESAGLDEEFAVKIREAFEAGLPQSKIRAEVLRTSDWNKWRYWRDLAGLPVQSPGYRNGSGPIVRDRGTF